MKTAILATLMLTSFAAHAEAGKDLRESYLYGADLRGHDLKGADLAKANLQHADLRGADLRGANLDRAYLQKASLAGADLRGAKFSTHLKGVEMKTTDFAGARIDASTVLPFSTEKALSLGMVLDSQPMEQLAER